MIKGSGSESLTNGSDPGGPKTYGSYGSGSATLDKQLCIVATEGFLSSVRSLRGGGRCAVRIRLPPGEPRQKGTVTFYYGTFLI
jgi:hypothetical protein